MSDLEKLSAKYAEGGSIKAIPRNKAQEILGNKLAGALRKFKDAASVEVPFTDSTLGELLVGKSPEALEDWSYGFGPIRMGRTDQGLMGAVTGMKADPRMVDVAGVAGLGQPLAGPLSRVAKAAVNPKMYKKAFFEAQAPAVKSNMIAYHGSPHKFDKFSLDKIGTGEGAQAYGYGLYFADNPIVAQGYKENLSKRALPKIKMPDGRMIAKDQFDYLTTEGMAWNRVFDKIGPRRDRKYLGQSIKDVILNARNLKGANDPEYVKRENDIASYLESNWSGQMDLVAEDGNLYKVDIPDESVVKMLLWDKPFSEQPETVQNALNNLIQSKRAGDMFDPSGRGFPKRIGFDEATGKTILENLQNSVRHDVRAEELLREYGVPGIRYLDQGSRDSGTGSMNTVLFDDSLVKILERNNQPLANLMEKYSYPQE